MPTWNSDPLHTSAEFVVRHMMISNVRGTFKTVSATLNYDPANPTAAVLEASVDLASVDTGFADRDNHLRSADFFDVENHPTMTFKSTQVEVTGENTAKVTGDLTIRGTTHAIVLDVELLGQSANPWTKAPTLGFSATGKLNREDFGLTWNQAMETGGVLVGKEVKIELNAELAQVVETVA